MWELHSQMQKVLAVGQSPCKRARRCSAHARGVSDKGGPWTALSFTYTHGQTAKDTQQGPNPLVSLTSERALPCGVWSPAREGQTSRVDTDRLGAASLGKLTFCFGTDEAGGGAVEEVQDPSHSHADVGVAGVEVQGCESLELELDKLLWGHFEMRDLGAAAENKKQTNKKKTGNEEDRRTSERERKEGRVR